MKSKQFCLCGGAGFAVIREIAIRLPESQRGGGRLRSPLAIFTNLRKIPCPPPFVHTLKETVLKNPHKAEVTRISNYPYVALEEILANAVYHRSYQINEPITVRITPAGIEITSFPGFDRSISDRQIEQYDIRARIYRNRRIGDFLKELNLIEGRNTGFPNARKALADNGSGDLTFEMNADRDYLSVTIPVHPYFLPSSRKADKHAEYLEEILRQLEVTPKTLTELAKAMGYKGISKKLRDAVTELLLQKRIRAIAEGKNVKYGL